MMAEWARKPRLPVFMPSIGMRLSAIHWAVRRKVPSPPRLMAASASAGGRVGRAERVGQLHAEAGEIVEETPLDAGPETGFADEPEKPLQAGEV